MGETENVFIESQYIQITLTQLEDWKKKGTGESGKFKTIVYYYKHVHMLNSYVYDFSEEPSKQGIVRNLNLFESKKKLPDMINGQKVVIYFKAISEYSEIQKSGSLPIIENIEIPMTQIPKR